MLQQRDNYGVREAHPTKRSLSIVVSRCNIKQQNIPDCGAAITNIIDIPEGITITCGLSNSIKGRVNKELVDDKQHSQHPKNMKNSYMVIEILNDVILQGLPMTSVACEHELQTENGQNIKRISFKHIILKYRLGFRQAVAFEIMSCSFILKSLRVQNISVDILHAFFQENENRQNKYADYQKKIYQKYEG